MAVLPGAVVGDLLERLASERRRVVLDGFEPHAGEWSSRWSQKRAARRAQAAAEAEVLERIADDLTRSEPGEPTAAEIVLGLTAAIRRDPEQAAIIVDTMLTDHPRMAVVIVATALRICPGLRKDILAQARRHKPFAKHPFILGLLLAFVAKVLADNSAEAAEQFTGAETPADILAALGRHFAAPRPGSDGERGGRDSRALGFGPMVTAPFVATVLAAGDAWSRTAQQDPSGRGEPARGEGPRARSSEEDMRPTADADPLTIEGGDGSDPMFRARQVDGDEPAPIHEGAASGAPDYRPDAAVAPMDASAAPARAMLGAAPQAGATPATAADAAAAATPAAEAAHTVAVDETEQVAALFERVLNDLVLAGDDALDAAALLTALTEELAVALAADDPADTLDLVASGEARGNGLVEDDQPAPLGLDLPVLAEILPDTSPGSAVPSDTGLAVGDGLVASPTLGVALLGDDGPSVEADLDVIIGLPGQELLAAISVEDTELAADIALALPGQEPVAEIGASAAVSTGPNGVAIDGAATASMADVLDVAADASISLTGGDGLQVEADALVALGLPGQEPIAEIGASATVAVDDTGVLIDGAIGAAVADVLDVAVDAGLGLTTDGGVDAEVALSLGLGAPDGPPVADVEAAVALVVDGEGAAVDATLAATLGAVDAGADVGIAVTDESVAVALDAAVAAGDVAQVAAVVSAGVSAEDGFEATAAVTAGIGVPGADPVATVAAGASASADADGVEVAAGAAAEVPVAVVEADLAVGTADAGEIAVEGASSIALGGPDADPVAIIETTAAVTAGPDGAAGEVEGAVEVAEIATVGAAMAVETGDDGVAGSVGADAALPGIVETAAAVAIEAPSAGDAPAVDTAVATTVVESVTVDAAAGVDPDAGIIAEVAMATPPGAPEVAAAVGVEVGPEPEIEAELALDDLISVDVAVTGGGIEVDLDLLPEAPPVVEEVVDTVETLLADLFGSADPEPEPPPAVIPPPPPPVPSLLYSLGGLFG